MYTYNPYWNGWYRFPTHPPYPQAIYQQPMHPSQANTWGYGNYANSMYAYQNPYMNSYNYTGYTETGNTNSSFDAGSIQKGVMNYFQNEEGQLDFDKMMSTTGQVMKTVQQVSPIVKGIGSFVKGIK